MMFCCLCFGDVSAGLPDMVLCDNGYPIIVSSAADSVVYGCRSYIQDKCENGYFKMVVYGSGLDVVGAVCTNGVVVHHNGVYVLNSLPTIICEEGYYNGGQCVGYTENSGLCPDDYRVMFDTNLFRLVLDSTECPSGTTVLGGYDGSHDVDEKQMTVWSYPYMDIPDNMIALRMCAVGYEMNYLGNCSKLCTVSGINHLRTNTGVSVPVYASKITTPSLNIKSGNAKQCYVNLLPESDTGAINIKYNDALYHAVN